MEVQEIGDRLEIAEVITRYTRAVDTRRWQDLDEVFTSDAVLDYTSFGGPEAPLAEAAAWIEQGLAGFVRYQHIIGQVAIGFADGERPASARATAYFTNPMVATNPDGSENLVEVGGYYHHDLVRTPRGWRSTRMVDEMVWMRGL